MISRMMRSVVPPKYAAAVPTIAEITVVPIETVRAIISERCRPTAVWANRSPPSAAVPNQCVPSGGVPRARKSR